MTRNGPKYQVGDSYYMKAPVGTLQPNEAVEIVCVHDKKKKRTFVDVQDINGKIFEKVSVKKLRKRPR